MGYLKHAARIFFRRVRTPVYLLLFLTRRCAGRCKHCFLRQSPADKPELTLEEIRKISASMDALLQLTLTGGDPVLRDDLPQIAAAFAAPHPYGQAGRPVGAANNRPVNITICTDGHDPGLVERQTRNTLQLCPQTGITVGCSLDGLGKEHDLLRGFPGLFDKMRETHRRLCALREEEPRLTLGVTICMSRYNQEKISDVYRFARDEMSFDSINVILVRGEPREPAAKDIARISHHTLIFVTDCSGAVYCA